LNPNNIYCSHWFIGVFYHEGDMYTGQFRNGVPDGKGVYQFANGDSYDGCLHQEVFEGEGMYIKSDGSGYQVKSHPSTQSLSLL
jgi:hypothetical protein